MKTHLEIIKLYKSEFQKYGDSPHSILTPKGRNKMRYSVLNDFISNDTTSLLDYGCGLGYLYQYLKDNSYDIKYEGMDIVDDFILACKDKYPEIKDSFKLINPKSKINRNYDITFASGVFNLLESEDTHESLERAYKRIKELFDITDKFLICDFPSPYVDFIQKDAQHFKIENLLSFCIKNLSRKFIIRHDVLPFEFTLILWKNDTILKPQNIYETK